jgi:hypothetical protein
MGKRRITQMIVKKRPVFEMNRRERVVRRKTPRRIGHGQKIK